MNGGEPSLLNLARDERTDLAEFLATLTLRNGRPSLCAPDGP